MRSYRLAFVLDLWYGVVDLILYFYISRTFEGFSSTDLGSAPSYFAFAAVGAVLGTVLDATSATVGYQIREEQVTGTFEVLTAQPVSATEICVGSVVFPFGFAGVRAVAYLAIAAATMGLDVGDASWIGLLLVLLAAGLAIAPIGILAGAAVLAIKRGQIVSTTLMYLFTVLAGMVFPISALPDWLEPVGRAVPVRFAFDGARDALFAGTGWGDDVLVLLLWAAALWPLSILLFGRALSFARRRGSLAQY